MFTALCEGETCHVGEVAVEKMATLFLLGSASCRESSPGLFVALDITARAYEWFSHVRATRVSIVAARAQF